MDFPVVARLHGSMKSLMRDGFHYIQYGDGSDELFDFMNDPFEENDLSDSDEHRKILEERLLAHKKQPNSGTPWEEVKKELRGE